MISFLAVFNPYVKTYVPFGNESACSFDTHAKFKDKMKNFNTQCAAGINKHHGLSSGGQAGVVILVLFVVTTIIVVIIVISLCYLTKVKHLKIKVINYDKIDEDRNNNYNN